MSACRARVSPPRQRLSAKDAIAEPSYWIYSLDEAVRAGMDTFVAYTRVSHRNQSHQSHDHQLAALRKACKERGLKPIVLKNAPPHESGKNPSSTSFLARACKVARDRGCAVLAISVDRFIRNAKFTAIVNEHNQPTIGEMNRLALIADGVQLVTVVPPYAEPSAIKSERVKRGLAASRRSKSAKSKPKGGPRLSPERRAHLSREAAELRSNGASLRQIASVLGVSHTTIATWLSNQVTV